VQDRRWSRCHRYCWALNSKGRCRQWLRKLGVIEQYAALKTPSTNTIPPISPSTAVPSASAATVQPTVPSPSPLPPLEVTCHARARIPTPHGQVFLHLYKNNRDDKEHLAIVVDSAQLSWLDYTESSSLPPVLPSTLPAQDATGQPARQRRDSRGEMNRKRKGRSGLCLRSISSRAKAWRRPGGRARWIWNGSYGCVYR